MRHVGPQGATFPIKKGKCHMSPPTPPLPPPSPSIYPQVVGIEVLVVAMAFTVFVLLCMTIHVVGIEVLVVAMALRCLSCCA